MVILLGMVCSASITWNPLFSELWTLDTAHASRNCLITGNYTFVRRNDNGHLTILDPLAFNILCQIYCFSSQIILN